jgi:hypothetical protein
MKFSILLAATFATSQAFGAIGLTSQYGVAFDAAGDIVGDGTLWALVIDSDNNNTFAGFSINDSLHAENIINPSVADTYFTSGQSISLGDSLGGGTVFAMGEINSVLSGGAGIYADVLNFDIGVNGVAANLEFAFYWFPGATFTGDQNDPQTIASEVGGINTTSNDGIFDIGMVMPADGSNVSSGAATVGGGGTLANTSFTAVTLVPEPTTALLAAFGSLALLRRRRVVEE